jgi:hypothetical protein
MDDHASTSDVGQLRYERRAVSDLTPDPANVRLHSDANLDAIRASLLRFGQQKPIVIRSDGVVIAGNGTLEAAKALGWSELDVVVTDLAGSDAIAFAIADNRTAELATWDEPQLCQVLMTLRDEGGDKAEGTGFSPSSIEALCRMTGLGDAANEDDLSSASTDNLVDGTEAQDPPLGSGLAETTCPSCGHTW